MLALQYQMNKKDKLSCEYKYRELMDIKSLTGTKNGNCKCWSGENISHYLVKCQIVHKLINEYKFKNVFTEVTWKDGRGRPDVFAYSGDLAVVIEVLHTEKEAKADLKDSYYPSGVPIIKVKTSEFNYEKFKI